MKFKNISIGFYGKHFVFWLLTVAVATTSVYVGQNLGKIKPIEASLISGPQIVESVAKQTIAISSNGKITLNGKMVSGILTLLPSNLELRLKLLDEPGVGIATHIVELQLPKPLEPPALEIKSPLIIHSIFSSMPTIRQINAQSYQIETLNLAPTAVYTLVVKMPKDYLALPVWQKITLKIGANIALWLSIGLTLPLLSVMIMLTLIIRVHRAQKTPKLNKPLTSLPARLPPAVVGLLTRGRITNRDIAATLIDLAWRKFVELYSAEDTFSLVKKIKLQRAGVAELYLVDKKSSNLDRLAPFEHALTSKIFYPEQIISHDTDIMFRVGHRLFSQKIARVYVGIYENGFQAGLFSQNPADLHRRLSTIGLIIFSLGLVGFSLDSILFGSPTLLFWVGMLCAGIVITQLGSFLNPLTDKGKAQLKLWLAFRAYLSAPEPIDYQSANQRIFEQYLPYAIALGVERQWLNRFSRYPFVIPDWFSTPDSVITLETFGQRLFAMIATTSQLLVGSKDPSVQ